MKDIFTIVLVIIGALIGAGFASGQEIYTFFYSYGIIGIIGVIITGILITITIYKVLKIIFIKEINTYEQFLKLFISNKRLTKIINILINVLLLITYYIMIAGFGAYFEQEAGISRLLGSGMLAIMTGIVFFTSVKGVLKVSQYIVPILILFIVIIGGKNILTLENVNEILFIKKGWMISSITYCSYNLILLIPTLITIKGQIKRKTDIKYISIITGIIIITLSIMIYMMIMRIDINISVLEMPIVYVIRKYFAQWKIIYAFIILASIFTTSISVGIGLLQNIAQNKRSYTQFVIFMCITSVVISNFGFSKLVKLMYPIFGYIGILQMIAIISKRI